MGRLILTRRPFEPIRLTAKSDVSAKSLMRQLQQDGISVTLGEIGHERVQIAFEAPSSILILREELCPSPSSTGPHSKVWSTRSARSFKILIVSLFGLICYLCGFYHGYVSAESRIEAIVQSALYSSSSL